MLYKDSYSEKLNEKLFRKPGSEYRAAPFWAWNGKLEKGLLGREIENMKKMGFGGFFMHARVGLSTAYLSEEFMDCVSHCNDVAKSEGLLSYLYDEDKWPSGFGGGLVTKNIKYREKYLRFTRTAYGEGHERAENGELLAVYDIVLDKEGCLESYNIIGEADKAKGIKYYVYLEYGQDSNWYNGESYVDTMSAEAIKEFIKITHEKYKARLGGEFGKSVPAIFTDEPQFHKKDRLSSPYDAGDICLPFTTDFPVTYEKTYGEPLLPRLPELLWELPDNRISVSRYNYHDHTAERFAEAFSDTLGKWCEENGILLTGHMMAEPDLECQSAYVGDCMRQYRSFGMPGIDILCDKRQETTAKQAQSASNQYGREGVTSELYGVTNWDFDFAGHKMQGDWQAALGITLRVPHLYWMSMAGRAKRDYPASIGHQSPWHESYSFVEDHFARVNAVMTRGTPCVKIGVIHPVESYWLFWGPRSQTGARADDTESRFYKITDMLLQNQLDFDYINESLLVSLYKETEKDFRVGHMSYSAVVVPQCVTMRSTTLDALLCFARHGGKIIIAGKAPEYIDGVKSARGEELASVSECVNFSAGEITSALDEFRTVDIRNGSGSRPGNIIYRMRNDGKDKYIFIAHFNKPYSMDAQQKEKYTVSFRGKQRISIMDTQNGEITEVQPLFDGKNTVLEWQCFACDSLLLRVTEDMRNEKTEEYVKTESTENKEVKRERLACESPYALDEPNVLLLDMPRYSLDGKEFSDNTFILEVGERAKAYFGIKKSGLQPWLRPVCREKTGSLRLRYIINSEKEIKGAHLAGESFEYTELYLNGEKITSPCDGYFVDEAIKTVTLPVIRKGENELTADIAFCEDAKTEAYYLLGDFGVRLCGVNAVLTELPEKLAFSDVSYQGLPFYGGNIEYSMTFTGDGRKTLLVNKFSGAALKITLDGEDAGMIAYPPYRITLDAKGGGEHKLSIKLLGTRMNTFGNIHASDEKIRYIGPDAYFTKDDMFSCEYILRRNGITRAPELLSDI